MKRTAIFFTSLLFASTAPFFAAAQTGERSFRFDGVPLRSSLDSLRKWFPIPIVFLDRDVEGKTTTAECRECGFAEALDQILKGTNLTWIRMDGQVILRRIVPAVPRPAGSISGTVRDSTTGEPVPGAHVLLFGPEGGGPLRWCSTNHFGYYSLRNIPPGGYALRIRSLGYRSVADSVAVVRPAPVDRDAALVQESIALQEVTVEGHRTSVRPAAGLTRGVYIRSAPVDQTEVLLDGARVYNPTHIGGALSAFNPEALNDIELQAGGIPPYYGGRLGGILDLSLRSGRLDRVSGTVGTGSLGAHGTLEGPVGKGTSILLSAQRGFPNLVVPGLNALDVPNRLGSTELIGRLTHEVSGRERLLLSAFFGRDRYTNSAVAGPRGIGNAFGWENTLLNLRWMGVVSPDLFVQASAAYTRYGLTLEHELSDIALPGFGRTSSAYSIEDLSLRAHAEHFYDEHHTVQGGVELIRHRIAGEVNAFATRLAPFAVDEPSAWELSVYMQDQWRILPSLTAEIGARATSFSSRGGNFSSVDPRFSLLLEPGGAARFFASITAVNQYLHPYRSTGIFALYPTLFWYPSTARIGPTTAMHLVGGMLLSPEEGTFEGMAEGFYRSAEGLHEPDTLGGSGPSPRLMEFLRTGSGRSYGVRCMVRKRVGGLTGSLSYTWSKSELTFPGINGGEAFLPLFDRRHEVQGSLHYAPDDRWSFGLQVVVVPGARFEEETQVWESKYNGALDSRADVAIAEGNRLPGFQRLELSIGYRAAIGGVPGILSLRLMNGYGLLDPIEWEPAPSASSGWQARFRSLGLFPLFPVFECTVNL